MEKGQKNFNFSDLFVMCGNSMVVAVSILADINLTAVVRLPILW
jgi:hypothetical protein